jgi:hypothetical protein
MFKVYADDVVAYGVQCSVFSVQCSETQCSETQCGSNQYNNLYQVEVLHVSSVWIAVEGPQIHSEPVILTRDPNMYNS